MACRQLGLTGRRKFSQYIAAKTKFANGAVAEADH